MAQTGYTPISLYYSTTASQAPTAGNLANGELAINITDGKLYYKDNTGTVKVIAGSGGTGIVAGSNTQVQYNNNGVFGASANMTFNGTTLSLTGLNNTGNTTLGDAAADSLTVNATVTSNLIFTDNTYNIGANGATRPANAWFSRTVTAGQGSNQNWQFLAVDYGNGSGGGYADGIYTNSIKSGTYQGFGFDTQYQNAGSWVSSQTSASIIDGYQGQFRVFTNSGLTAGTPYTPTLRLSIGTTGLAEFRAGVTDPSIVNSITISSQNGTPSYGGIIGQRYISADQRQGLFVKGTGSLTLLSQYNIDFLAGQTSVPLAADTGLMLRINTSGVAVGGINPTYPLDVFGASASAGELVAMRLQNGAGSTASVGMIFQCGANSATAGIYNYVYTTNKAQLQFRTRDGTNLETRYYIDGDGVNNWQNIGATGNGVTAQFAATGFTYNLATNSGGVTLQSSGVTANQSLGYFLYDSNHGVRLLRDGTGAISNVFDFLEYGGSWRWIKANGSTVSASLNDTGMVIGSDSPSYKLQVGNAGVSAQSGLWVPGIFNWSGAYLQQSSSTGRGGRLIVASHVDTVNSSAFNINTNNDVIARTLQFSYAADAASLSAASFSALAYVNGPSNVWSFGTSQTTNNARLVVAGAYAGVGAFSWAERIGATSYTGSGGDYAMVGYGVETGSFSKAAFGYKRLGAYDIGQFVWALDSTNDTSTVDAADIKMTLDYLGQLTVNGTTAQSNYGKLQVYQESSGTVSSLGFIGTDNATISSKYSLVFQVNSATGQTGRTFDWKKGGKGYSDGTQVMSLAVDTNQLQVGTTQSFNDIYSASVYPGVVSANGLAALTFNGGGSTSQVARNFNTNINATYTVRVYPSDTTYAVLDIRVGVYQSSGSGYGNAYFAYGGHTGAYNLATVFNNFSGNVTISSPSVAGGYVQFTITISNSGQNGQAVVMVNDAGATAGKTAYILVV